jgi:hypothetical protein
MQLTFGVTSSEVLSSILLQTNKQTNKQKLSLITCRSVINAKLCSEIYTVHLPCSALALTYQELSLVVVPGTKPLSDDGT